MPPEIVGQDFQIHLSFRIDEALAPLRQVVPMAFLCTDVEVLSLTVHCVSQDKCLWIQPYRADPALPQRKAAGEADHDIGSDDHGRSASFDGQPHKFSDLFHSDKDSVVLCSSDDSEVELDPGTSGGESGASAADTRPASGAFQMDLMVRRKLIEAFFSNQFW